MCAQKEIWSSNSCHYKHFNKAQQPWNTNQEAQVMTMATDGACVWTSLNNFMAFSTVCPKDTGCHVLPATLFMWAGIKSGSFGSAPNSPAWEGGRLKFSTTDAFSTGQRITRECVWSRAVHPVVSSQRATQIQHTGSDERQARVNTEVCTRAEHRVTTTHKLHDTERHQRVQSFPPSPTNCFKPSKSQSSGCTDHPPASPFHCSCDAHSLRLFAL